jgi:diaminohydroxyphosphoribosylaminopyrimidine deaminase/5-amino-6-(5-phosphoribosylamino)uracil reductase
MTRAQELRFMRRALTLARRGTRTFPNPKVGCVLVKDGRIIAEGWHAVYGGPHAEAAALKKAGTKARGATAFVTLEPCCAHPGKKTPPCADALANAGVVEVVAALRDPNPGVAGKGLSLLRRAGLRTRVGLGAAQAGTLNADFLSRMKTKKTYVILKTALSLDGKASAVGGKSRWVTGPHARNMGHELRTQVDAILVGIGTILVDDPSLTSHGFGRDPVRVVLDTRGRLPARSKVLDGKAPTWVFTASSKKFKGAQTIRVQAKKGRLDLTSVLRELARRGIGRLLVEGGPTVHAAFLAERAVDEARVFIAPKFLSGTRDPNSAPRLNRLKMKKVGPDILFYGKVH